MPDTRPEINTGAACFGRVRTESPLRLLDKPLLPPLFQVRLSPCDRHHGKVVISRANNYILLGADADQLSKAARLCPKITVRLA